EYGNYTVLQNTDTLYEETYTRRYYDNGVLDKIVECRDVLTAEGEIEKNGVKCFKLRTNSYENNVYDGYSLTYIDEEGNLVQQDSYDSSNNIVFKIKLVSNDGFLLVLIVSAILLIVVIGVVAFIFYYTKKRNRDQVIFREMPRSRPYWEMEYTENEGGRTIPDSVLCNHCGMRISASSNFCTFCGERKNNQ
ncbi:MAG: hypothetical protein ACTSP4_06120, partial [Candidatus Hodarchaeales archaeon]